MVRSITWWIGFRIWCEALYYGRQEWKCWGRRSMTTTTIARLIESVSHVGQIDDFPITPPSATIIPLDWLQPSYTMPTLILLRLLPRRQVLPTGLRVSNPNMAQPSMSRPLPRKGVSRSASMTTLEQAEPMVRRRRAALTGIQESGQVLGLDLRQVSRQNSGRSTHALEHGPA